MQPIKLSLSLHAMLAMLTEQSLAFSVNPRPAQTRHQVSKTRVLSANTDNDDFATFTLDYQAANEFIEAHYPQLYHNQSYFHADGVQEEMVWNARRGVVMMEEGKKTKMPTSIGQNGFTLFHQPTQVTDFTDLEQVKSIYLPELLDILEQHLDISLETHHILFWNPVMRGTELESKERLLVPSEDGSEDLIIEKVAKSTTAGMVHIDTDVGAHPKPDGFLNVMYKNRVIPKDAEGYSMPTVDNLKDEIDNGKRFFVVNFWRNADPQNAIIQRAPLGVYLPCYDTNFSGDNDKSRFDCFPGSRPHSSKSRWYYYPEMTYDEVFVFRQYDRDANNTSDLWHSALKNLPSPDNNDNPPPRLSFDIRALIVAKDETVPRERDRYAADRIQPNLSFEVSRDEFAKQQDERQTQREKQQNMS